MLKKQIVGEMKTKPSNPDAETLYSHTVLMLKKQQIK